MIRHRRGLAETIVLQKGGVWQVAPGQFRAGPLWKTGGPGVEGPPVGCFWVWRRGAGGLGLTGKGGRPAGVEGFPPFPCREGGQGG